MSTMWWAWQCLPDRKVVLTSEIFKVSLNWSDLFVVLDT